MVETVLHTGCKSFVLSVQMLEAVCVYVFHVLDATLVTRTSLAHVECKTLFSI